MKPILLLAAALAFVAPSFAQSSPQKTQAEKLLDQDLRLLLQWFPGRFDNQEQVAFAKELGIPADAVPEHIHSIFKPVDLPTLGQHVFYVQQYMDADPEKIYRQRFYVFSADYAQNAVRLDILTPKDAAAVKDAHLDAAKLARIAKEDVTSLPGCEVYWRRQGAQFIGGMKEGACRIKSQRSGRTIIVTDDLLLNADEIWIRDTAVDENGAYVYGNKAGIHHKLRRAQPWVCWGATVVDAEKDDWEFKQGLEIHDQGGRVFLPDAKGQKRHYLRLRQVRWPDRPNLPALTLYVHEEGNPRAISYSRAAPDSQQIGINLRHVQAGCRLADVQTAAK
jgi:hypothetical protein